ncbi:hypothetical protein BO79DRAFT_230052 [Aspergillus costaricaensis CBS 115574]|uniref:Uncharacterized protein n=1 Tax=Aspergillus costaricaensis CBS 115574 TaxID=1448317 RepID=A0ACD1I903_9EURO|nr:hypothetical protein BO79DRAFT_230052 [Aspergillus costaricaensis CBS 115574]RAK86840.1 hypothetical protein BO79DRAFT_230052 [Aspergillus costaricaensis CBS 115574]
MRGGRGSARGAATIDNNGVERAGPITTPALRVSPWNASCSTGNLIGLGHNRSDTDVHLEVQAIQRVQINKSSHATTTPDEDQSSVG